MIEAQRRAYLQAMGFELWLRKPPEPLRDRLLLGPGEGRVLLITEFAQDCATPLAADIVRVLGAEAVWAWPDPDGDADRPTLEQAVGGQLSTLVVIFGNALARRLLRTPDDVIASAAVVRSECLATLAVSAAAKRELWLQLLAQLPASRLDRFA
ncbi:MAG: hypothetical protein RQ826_05540 [Xanthomonadales bacterium]|nr:hypothetical protein [Xanthomonadales bacterium]